MTRTERALARRWRGLLVSCLFLALAGAVLIIWSRIDAADRRAEQLTAEANRRGQAVAVLAGDVRVLRAQIDAKGGKPQAPPPERAVNGLTDRVQVPVPIPGPRGAEGREGKPGRPGEPAPTITPQPGASGAPGRPGADSTVPGPQGPQGEPGADSTVPGPQGPQGERGPEGPPPAGWTFTYGGTTYDCRPDSEGSDHYTCTPDKEPEPQPQPEPSSGLLSMGLDPSRRQWI